MKILGLTGGIGSGKSLVGSMLREKGVPVIDADAIGHRLLADDPEVQKDITELFGPEIFEDDSLSRDRLAARVFSDAGARARLNAVLHPAIIRAITDECEVLAGRGHDVVVVEAALVGEEGRREPWLSGLILVLAAKETRVQRLVTMRKMREDDARQRIAAQTDPVLKVPIADWIIYNDGDLETLDKEVSRLAAGILTHEARPEI